MVTYTVESRAVQTAKSQRIIMSHMIKIDLNFRHTQDMENQQLQPTALGYHIYILRRHNDYGQRYRLCPQ